MENKIDSTITISRVTLLNYIIDETYNPKVVNEEVNFVISHKTSFDFISETGNYSVTFNYSDLKSTDKFLEITVLSVFNLPALRNSQEWDENNNPIKGLKVPRVTLINCLAVAISNTRAILTQLVSTSTLHGRIPFKIVDPNEVGNLFYPQTEGDMYPPDQTK